MKKNIPITGMEDQKSIDNIVEEGEIETLNEEHLQRTPEEHKKFVAEEYSQKNQPERPLSDKEKLFLQTRDKAFVDAISSCEEEDVLIVVGMGHVSGFYENDLAEQLKKKGYNVIIQYLDEVEQSVLASEP